ncbi:MAG: IS3 family transposase [Candidatus Cloacimonetes bacterium]|nr:IS3 family transposase [Candidatus Cloacimonadota bacterium]
MMDIVEKSTLTIKRTCTLLKLNPGRYYDWQRRFDANRMEGLKNHKSSPKSCPHTLLEEEKELIIEYALEHPDIRHRKLALKMQNNNIAFVSPSTVYRVLKANDLIPEKEYNKEPQKEADGKIKVSEPHQVWHTDITYIPVKDGHAYLISVLDDYSRFVVHSELSRTMTSDDMERVLSKALHKADLYEKPADERPALVSDNGTQLISNSFTEFLKEWDIQHRRIAVRHPESNGKIEVLHKTIKHENVYTKERYESFYEAERDIKSFLIKYNYDRLHQGINFVTPYEKYSGEAEQIIKKRKQRHKKAIERRKRINRKRQAKAA